MQNADYLENIESSNIEYIDLNIIVHAILKSYFMFICLSDPADLSFNGFSWVFF